MAENIPRKKQHIHTNLNEMSRALAQRVTQPVGIETIKVQACRNPKDIRSFFGVSNQDNIGRIRRIVTMESVPYFYENFMPVELARRITRTDLAKIKSVQKILRTKIGLKVTKGKNISRLCRRNRISPRCFNARPLILLFICRPFSGAVSKFLLKSLMCIFMLPILNMRLM